ncbi:MAG: 4Fe-4S binding protein [Defluviitaleaceae bacterium]|nr:4Fe-4S binding protein [Defluviitaleaceae bacterium]
MNIGKTVATQTWQEMTHGSHVFKAGNALEFQTGDWRSVQPVWLKDKCKQCMLCVPVCPDSSIPVNENGQIDGFDLDYCKGCLICKEICPFEAIESEDA